MEQVTKSRPFVPGTVHLVDLEGTMHAKHASKGHKDIVLVPAPSNDPDDPLNWSPRRKLLSTSCMCMYTLMVSAICFAVPNSSVLIAARLVLPVLRSTRFSFLSARPLVSHLVI